MNEVAAMKVVLLARAGDARDRLSQALDGVGATLALAADPLTAELQEVIDAAPQAVLVGLEPAIEDALERFDSLLGDPGMLVIFDEVEIAAQRSDWDTARWMRHLSSKLHRHGDVLPPGTEQEGDMQPSPGPLPPRRITEVLELADFADEAQGLAGDVPTDETLLPAAVDASAEAGADGFTLELTDDLDMLDYQAPANGGIDAVGGGFVVDGVEEVDAGDFSLAEIEDASGADAVDLPAHASDDSISDVAMESDVADPEGFPDGGFALADPDAALAEPAAVKDDVDPFADSTLSLADEGAVPLAAPVASSAPSIDLDALEQRASGLSLAEEDSYGHGPLRGTVIVDGGLGGPDAVRQLLAALPEEFPRSILIRLQLDGGRYDRLVSQMQRATTAPVLLAEAGQALEAGTIYFMTPTLQVGAERGQLKFADGAQTLAALLAVVPANDSALLLLSGSDAAVVDAAAQAGLLLAGQSPDTCYDPAAALALIARGGHGAAPADLAAYLADRWPS